MSGNKDWREEFDEKFGTADDVIFGGKKDGMDMHELYIKLKDFIASQIEKTRREVMTGSAKATELSYRYGKEAGLKRALELMPEDKLERTLSEHMAFQDACMKYKENLKKEMEK